MASFMLAEPQSECKHTIGTQRYTYVIIVSRIHQLEYYMCHTILCSACLKVLYTQTFIGIVTLRIPQIMYEAYIVQQLKLHVIFFCHVFGSRC